MDAQSVLDVDPGTVADQLGIRSVLSKGRNDGLASMMSVVQNQIRRLLGRKDPQNESLEEMGENPSRNQTLSSLPNQSVEDNKPTVAMLLSGGVDSSVALNLLVRQGYNVTAFYLKIWLEDELAHLGQCPWEDDYRVCTQVCEQAGVPLESISLQNEYMDKVISYTIHEAKKGRTPNPDIMCNSRVKFGCFYDAISQRNFDHVATGHYAQLEEIQHSDGTVERKLLRAPDPIKDQSYFLAALTQGQLSKVLFPIGQFEKSRVRELATEYNLPNKNRPDSQGLCFLGKVKFDEFLSEYLGTEPGDIVDAETNEVIGRHNGIWYHTVGQRKGLGKVLDPIATSRGPWYVVAKDTSRRLIIASNQYDEEDLKALDGNFLSRIYGGSQGILHLLWIFSREYA
jgi:tRNA (5-methylaminomethyl-2-thiouridylate)-methyltransferase